MSIIVIIFFIYYYKFFPKQRKITLSATGKSKIERILNEVIIRLSYSLAMRFAYSNIFIYCMLTEDSKQTRVGAIERFV